MEHKMPAQQKAYPLCVTNLDSLYMKNFFRNIFGTKSVTSNKSFFEDLNIEKPQKNINELITTWRTTNLKLNDPASAEIIIDTQQQLNYVFPKDFLNFYAQVNGFKDWDVIGEMFSIWNLERIVEEHEKSDDKNFIPFCDYLIDSHRIGYLKNQSGVYKDYDQTNKIADKFEEVIHLIIENSELLY